MCLRSIKKLSSLLLLCLLLVSFPTTCGAAEMSYQITASQLMEWQTNLNQLKSNNQRLQTLLEESKLDSEIVNQQLALSLANSQKLELQIQEALNDAIQSKKLSIQMQEQLKVVNESFQTLQKAEKSKIRKVTLERDALILYAIYKAFVDK